MVVKDRIMDFWSRHPQLALALGISLVSALVTTCYCYGQSSSKKNKITSGDKDKEKDPQRKRNRLDSSSSIRSSRSDLEKSPSFSKSPSYFELTNEDTSATLSPEWTALGLEQPLVIAMVGLPARGKSYLVKMIMRYLKWTGFESKVFNVGSFRRQVLTVLVEVYCLFSLILISLGG